jgi:hypothetical protein
MQTNAIEEILEETEELKTTSLDFDYTQSFIFEETTEYFDIDHITTGFNYEFEEVND